jgi:glycosyltransferase involved in cell wall biosynthesis
MSGPILYVLKRFPRLSETFVLRELLGLEARGKRILIDSLLPPEGGPRHEDVGRLRAEVRYLPRRPRLSRRGVFVAHVGLALRRPARWARLAMAARREGTWRRFLQGGLAAARARREGARHIHAHFATAATEVAAVAGALADVRVSVTAHAKDIYQRENAALLERRLRRVDVVVTVSEHNVRHLRGLLPGIRVVHVPNGVTLPPPVRRDPSGPLLCVARLVPKKGVDVLLEALAILGRDHPDLRAEIVGGGDLAGELEEKADALALGGRVRFLGPVPWEEVEAAYGRCSMLVLPCRIAPDGDRDGMPTALTEAAARGLPIVSTDVAGIPELVRHGDTGLLVPPEDAEALAAAISKLLHDPGLADGLGASARSLVAQRFDPNRSLDSLLRIFEGRLP